MSPTPTYQFNIGEVIQTYDERIGIITELTNAHEYMAYSAEITDETIRSYMHIPIYKVLMNGSITHVSESNIMEVVECDQKNM